jgi:hypothetical protein
MIASYANPSLVFGEEAFAVELVLEHPKQWQDLVVLSVEVLSFNSLVRAFAFDVRYFALHSCNKALLV